MKPEKPTPNSSQDQSQRLESLFDLSRSWRMEWKIELLLNSISEDASELLGMERGIVFLLEKNGLIPKAYYPGPGAFSGFPMEEIFTMSRQVVQTGRSITGHQLDTSRSDTSEYNISTAICVPLNSIRGILGALYFDSDKKDTFSTQDEEFLETVALQASAAIDHALLYQSAITDPLTGLYSHRHFQQSVEQAVRHAERSGQAISLVIMDLDHFKDINDTYGHDVGNECLIQVGNILRNILRDSDILARFGGDEFEILLPDTDSAMAEKVAEKIRRKLEKERFSEHVDIKATLGVASFPKNGKDGQTLFLRADEALYDAKKNGRNCTVTCSIDVRAGTGISNRGKGSKKKDPQDVPDTAPLHLDTRPMNLQIDGHTVVSRLGEGTAGEVFLARQPELDREVALKRPSNPHPTLEQAQTFEMEARVTASLKHPGVITVYTMGRDVDGRRYYTMKPLTDGMSLDKILEGIRDDVAKILHEYTHNHLLEILQRTAETIAYAHSQEVTHLDITPRNIIIGEYGEVTVIDWGMGASSSGGSSGGSGQSRVSPHSGKLKLILGSPAYKAPEFLPGNTADVRFTADVYSLGAILYEILTGYPPYQGDNTREILTKVSEGELIPPEEITPEAGIDPVISDICVKSLNPDPDKRPSAKEFAETLARYLRHESEMEEIVFSGEHPLKEDEWTPLTGNWTLENGEWITRAKSENILIWNVPVTGSFRFTCEGWIEEHGELSIIGHGPSMRAQETDLYRGYFFQFGAEENTCTKLARHEHDVMAVPGMSIEPGRRYTLTMEYNDGWLQCFLDNKRIFTYRELFPFSGKTIGLYGWGKNVHFKPLNVQRQLWGISIPAIQLADDLMNTGLYRPAMMRYEQIAENVRHTLKRQEAILKKGICLDKLRKQEEARKIFHSLYGTTFEPFAMAHEAKMEVNRKHNNQPEKAVEIFSELMRRHPKSQARIEVLNIVSRLLFRRMMPNASMKREMELNHEVYRLGALTSYPPAQSQLKCYPRLAKTACYLGKTAEVLDLFSRAVRDTLPRQLDRSEIEVSHAILSLATGNPIENNSLTQINPSRVNELRPNEAASFFAHVACMTLKPEFMSKDTQLFTITDLLRRGDFNAAKKTVCPNAAKLWTGKDPSFSGRPFSLLALFIDAEDEEPFLSILDFIRQLIPKSDNFLIKLYGETLTQLFEANRHIELHRFDQAAKAFQELQNLSHPEKILIPIIRHIFDLGILTPVILSTLGHMDSSVADKYNDLYEIFLCGPELELCEMMLGKRAPEPTEHWPHPLWCPDLRLWLGMWLEEKGEYDKALETVRPSIDSRFGLTNRQPALNRLVKRVENRQKSL